MNRRALLAGLTGVVLSRSRTARAEGGPQPVTLRARDGVSVFGAFLPAAGAARGTILLFHQAGSNRFEYAPIMPELSRLGWASLAIDQRAGGRLWGHENETVRARGGGTGFGPALADLEAALDWAMSKPSHGPILIWGSSYSAALVFVLAAAHPADMAGVLAFSPGEFISGTNIRAAAARVTCPVFVTSASDSGEIADARTLINASPAKVKRQFVPRSGVHGSSTLRQDSNPAGSAQAWEAVRAFLNEAVPA